MNDYWNQILSAQGRGWAEWRPPSDSGSIPPPWMQNQGMSIQPWGQQRPPWMQGWGQMQQGQFGQRNPGFSLGGGRLWPQYGNLSMLGIM